MMGFFKGLKDAFTVHKLNKELEFCEYAIDTIGEMGQYLDDMVQVAYMRYFLTERDVLGKEVLEEELGIDDDLQNDFQYYINLLLENDLYDDYRVWVVEQMQECEDEFEDDEDLD